MKNDIQKLRWAGFLLACLMTVALGVSAIRQHACESSFHTVQAKLVRVDERYGTTPGTKMTLYKTAYYEYTVDGENYVSSQAMLPVSFRKVGLSYQIRYNPENPMELQDLYQWYTTLAAGGMLAIVCVALGKIVFSDRKSYLSRK